MSAYYMFEVVLKILSFKKGRGGVRWKGKYSKMLKGVASAMWNYGVEFLPIFKTIFWTLHFLQWAYIILIIRNKVNK